MNDIKQIVPIDLLNLASLFPKTNPLYIVGGFVRDFIAFNKKSGDIDIASNLPPEKVREILTGSNYKVFDASPRLGTIIIKGERSYEYTTFRKDSYPNEKGDHTPTGVVFIEDINLDAQRRDFKCNAIYYDILNDKIVDPLNGIKDIENKILSTVQDPYVVLSQDGLRIMRLVRQVSTFGFNIEEGTAHAAKELVSRLKDISVERIQVELVKLLNGDNVYQALCYMRDLNILEVIIPELAENKDVTQNKKYHDYDVLTHIFKTVEAAPKKIRLAALFHDVAKKHCYSNEKDRYNHDIIGEKITREVLKRLKFSNEEIEHTCCLVRQHMIDINKTTKVNKLRKAILANSNYIEDIIMLMKADAIGTGKVKENEINLPIEREYLYMKENNIPLSLKDLKINGHDLINLGITGVKIKEILNEMLLSCAYEKLANQKEALLQYATKKKDNKLVKN